jgi:hypothetical protein
MKICNACRKEVSIAKDMGRRDTCPACGADLQSCLNCRFYDRAASKQCREPIAELVKAKDKANYCDHFLFAEARQANGGADPADHARKALDGLFKK